MSIISLPLEEFDIHSISFGYRIKNNVIENNYFYNITYSNVDFNMINIFLHFHIYDYTIEQSKSEDKEIKRFFFKFNEKDTLNQYTVEYLKMMEELILKQAQVNKTPICKLYKQFQKGYFNVFRTEHKYLHMKMIQPKADENIIVYVKLTGIWENETEYGLVYKLFIK
jgi:hypothetical protein